MKAISGFLCLFTFLIPFCHPACAQGNLGRQVLDVFEEHCAECHGPDLAQPKARFGYILDLEKLTSTEDPLVIPKRPEDSYLYFLVDNDRMPKKRPNLSSEEKTLFESGFWLALPRLLRRLRPRRHLFQREN